MNFKLDESSDCGRILSFLVSVDNEFYPALHSRVNLVDYSTKLAENAINFFLRKDGEDIAHAAFYCNDFEVDAAFITSIAVAPSLYGSGAASYLIRKVFQRCKESERKLVRLEVDLGNIRAVNFYKKHGFFVVSENMMMKRIE